MGSSPALAHETRQVLLAGGQVFFLAILRFHPALRQTWLKVSGTP